LESCETTINRKKSKKSNNKNKKFILTVIKSWKWINKKRTDGIHQVMKAEANATNQFI
jgi:hypothetical protein